MKTIFIIIFLFFSNLIMAQESDVLRWERWKDGNVKPDEVQTVKDLALKGNSQYQLYLGMFLLEGKGIDKNPNEAITWFQKASGKESKARNMLGLCYLEGKGVEKDLNKAVEYLKPQADKGDNYAIYNLGKAYWELKNYNEAFNFFKKGVDNGNIPSRLRLGSCYQEGLGTKKDIKKAIDLFKPFAIEGDGASQHNLATCYYQLNNLAEFTKWTFLAAINGSRTAQFNLGKFYLDGKDIAGNIFEKNINKSYYWIQKSAEQGYPDAQEALKGFSQK